MGNVMLDDAISRLLSDSTLKSIHGNGTVIRPWKNNVRNIEYAYDVRGVSHPLKRFIIKDDVPIVVRQTVSISDKSSEARITNQVFVKCFGSRFISIKSTFDLIRKEEEKQAFMCAKVMVNVALPGSNKTERLLIHNAQNEINKFVDFCRSCHASAS